jgi:CheY-like chemotaxis protein
MFGFGQRRINELQLNLPADEARKRARILVIDDDKEAFPVQLLQKEGYNIHYWPKVENIRPLEEGEFDIIFLDIGGISPPELSKTDGLGILEHLKRHNPGQIVVAYSGRSFDLSQQRFFKLADDFLGKPSDLLECKEKIDQLLQAKFTAMHYWNTLLDVLKRNDVPEKKIKDFETLFVKNAERKRQVSLESIMTGLKISKELAQVIAILLGLVFKFYSDR